MRHLKSSVANAISMKRMFFDRIRRLTLALQIIESLILAWVIKSGRRMARVKLPATPADRSLSERDLLFLINGVDLAVRFGTPWTARKCFFRAFIIASILRKRGQPVEMNVGLSGLHGPLAGKRVDGHCWLTIDNRPFVEPRDPHDEYPDFLGIAPNGVRYWLGLGQTTPAAARTRLGCWGLHLLRRKSDS